MPHTYLARIAFLVWCVACGASARADDFYKGKTITIVVGATPGGAFDISSRALARYFPKYIPGAPSVVVQNMPGAGSIAAIRYVDATAPRDGTVIGVFLPGVLTQSLVTPDKINVDLRNLTWLGVISPDNSRICYGYGPKGVKSWDELMRLPKDAPFIMGTTGSGASNYINGASLREVLGANIKIIMGFPGSSEMRLAIERGELDGDCGGISSLPPDWLRERKIFPFVRFAESRPASVPESAIYVGAFAKTDEQRQFLKFLYEGDKLGRPLIMSRQTPPDRLAILRSAFNETMKDPVFIAEMSKLQESVLPFTGQEAEAIYTGMKSASPDMLAKARKIYE